MYESIQEVSSHSEYSLNMPHDLHKVAMPIAGDLTTHTWTVRLIADHSFSSEMPLDKLVFCVFCIHIDLVSKSVNPHQVLLHRHGHIRPSSETSQMINRAFRTDSKSVTQIKAWYWTLLRWPRMHRKRSMFWKQHQGHLIFLPWRCDLP